MQIMGITRCVQSYLEIYLLDVVMPPEDTFAVWFLELPGFNCIWRLQRPRLAGHTKAHLLGVFFEFFLETPADLQAGY